MCIMCDGASRDEALFSLHGSITRYGWAVQGVEGSALWPPWAYTIGLLEACDHPELVMVGGDLLEACRIVDRLAHAVWHERTYDDGDLLLDPGGGLLTFSLVDDRHWEGTRFAAWKEYYASLGDPDLEPEALQVRRVDDAGGTRLDRWSPDDPCRMSRAARRYQARRRR